MILLLSYLGGVLTILSPCILPVLPFVFARAGQPFRRSGLPLLLGMSVTFAAVATLAAIGGGWAVQANQYGRVAAMLMLAFFGITLLFPALADHLTRPLVAWGGRLSQAAQGSGHSKGSVVPSFVLGIATGLLWAPCAGPILGLVLTGAALQGASTQTSLLLLAYAAGAATSLAVALLIGGRVFAAMKRSLGIGEWVRRGLGVAVLVGVAAIALGLDTGALTKLSGPRTSSFEQALIDRIHPPAPTLQQAGAGLQATGKPMPDLSGAVQWLNSAPLSAKDLRGKVVLVDFWTYSCINCLRTLPYIRAWAEKYKDQGLVVIGVHAPEFAFEKSVDNVRQAIKDLDIRYPVVIDNNYAIWRAFDNQFWPAHYFVDAKGLIRYHHYGEGDYAQSEAVIQQLLIEAGKSDVPRGTTAIETSGIGLAPAAASGRSPETYIGFSRAQNFASAGGQIHDQSRVYLAPSSPSTNQWGLSGEWKVLAEKAQLISTPGRIVYRFHARDLHLVLGPGATGKSVRFKVLIDGQEPGADHGVDTDGQGLGVVDSERLYQLVRLHSGIQERTFEIEFLDPGVEAFAFTFG